MSGERVRIEMKSKMARLMMEYYLGAKGAESTDRKIAWVTSGAPVELIYAADVIPIYPENHAALCGAQKMGDDLCMAAEAEGYSRDICSYARTDLGAIFTKGGPFGGLPKPDFLLCCNNICGTVTKWYQNLQRIFDVPLLYIDTPFLHGEATEAQLVYVQAQLTDVSDSIGEIVGKPIEQDRLEETLRLGARTMALWGDILDLQANKPSPMTSFDTFILIAPAVCLRGTQQCVDFYEEMMAEIKQRVADGVASVPGERFRLAWDNLPIWFKIREIANKFSQHKACLVAATYARAWAQVMNENATDVLREFATAYLTVYINRGLDFRVKTLKDMVDDFSLDGIVMHSDRSCKAYSLGQYELARSLKQEYGIPSLILEADMNDSRVYADEAIDARIDAFMEMLAG